MYVAYVMRHNSTGRLRSQPAVGKAVAVTKPGHNKALEPMGANGSPPVLPIMDQQGHICFGQGSQRKNNCGM
eukprot:12928544-Prorocentrum_lima.AAC.1